MPKHWSTCLKATKGNVGKGNVEDFSRLGHGISYTQTMVVQDMWTQWADNQSSHVPFNIRKGEMVAHVFDNID